MTNRNPAAARCEWKNVVLPAPLGPAMPPLPAAGRTPKNRSFARSEFPPDKPAGGASAVFIDADQKARRTRDGFEVRERSSFEERGHPLPPRVGIDLCKAFGQGPHRAGSPQGHSAGTFQQRVQGATQLGPELDLSRNRSFRNFGRKLGVKDKFVGKSNRLAHTSMVAFCYCNGKFICRRAAVPQILHNKAPKLTIWKPTTTAVATATGNPREPSLLASVAKRLVVALKPGNACGAKGPHFGYVDGSDKGIAIGFGLAT